MSTLIFEVSPYSGAHFDGALLGHWNGPQPLVALSVAHRGKGIFSISLCPGSRIPRQLDSLAASPASISAELRVAGKPRDHFKRLPRHRLLKSDATWACFEQFGEKELPINSVTLVIPTAVSVEARARILELIDELALGPTFWRDSMVNYMSPSRTNSRHVGAPTWLRFPGLLERNIVNGDPFTLLIGSDAFSTRRSEIESLVTILKTKDMPSGYITPTACRHLFPELPQASKAGDLLRIDAKNRIATFAAYAVQEDMNAVEETEGEILIL